MPMIPWISQSEIGILIGINRVQLCVAVCDRQLFLLLQGLVLASPPRRLERKGTGICLGVVNLVVGEVAPPTEAMTKTAGAHETHKKRAHHDAR